MGTIDYHLQELAIALDPDDPRRVLPELRATDRRILDVGCGVGQTLVALACKDRMLVGVDPDERSIRYGIENYGTLIHFIRAPAERIPLPQGVFDLAYCRVSLPYTNIPAAVGELRRLLRAGGRVWMTLHDRDMARARLREAFGSGSLKRIVHASYVLANGYLFKYFGIVAPYLTGSRESWQHLPAMRRLLERKGFSVTVRRQGRHVVVEGVLPEDVRAASAQS